MTFTFEVRVEVDPTDQGLAERIDEGGDTYSVADVLRAEIESNLESLDCVAQGCTVEGL